ncbi:5'/3'-nucleotidase SurE [Rapidithrix thailandica]|uniref:5'-nucleotidase SurE n=1 Tax=Rapidithrix thailandica TaxID=413964 RepID=A0AAW9SA81_9BACT
MANQPLILISNDDGITAKGIRHLVEWMQELGDVVVVAPDSPQSGMGHAITINDPLKCYKSDIFPGVEAYECSGTPADCIKLAKNYILNGRVPNLVVSGINHGSNASVSVLYSGTMSAAIEAGIEGMPAIGFSLCDYDREADFSHTYQWVKNIAIQALEKGIPQGTTLNVNLPARNKEEIKGVKTCRQAKAKWQENFDERVDPYGRKYLWLTGDFIYQDEGSDTDIWAIENNYISIVPVKYDMTAHQAISEMNEKWEI